MPGLGCPDYTQQPQLGLALMPQTGDWSKGNWITLGLVLVGSYLVYRAFSSPEPRRRRRR